MVLATFWCSYIAAYKLWRFIFRTDSATVVNRILQQSLKNNEVKTYVSTDQMEMNDITSSAESDSSVPVESDPATVIACEKAVDMETVSAFVPEISGVFERVTATGHDVSFEKETVYGMAQELTLDVKSVTAFVPECAESFETVTAIDHDIPFKVATVNGIAHEFTLELESVTAFEPEFAFQIESVSAVTEIPFEEEIMSGISHKFTEEVTDVSTFEKLSEQVRTVSPLTHEAAFEVESVGAVSEIPVKEEIVSGVSPELSEEVRTVSALTHEAVFELESVSAVTEIPFKPEIVNEVAQKFSEEVKTVSAFSHEFSSKVETVDTALKEEFTLDSTHELSTGEGKAGSSFGHECSFEFDVGSAKHRLNVGAKEFVPQSIRIRKSSSFGDVGSGIANAGNAEETGFAVEVTHPVTLNAQAEEFVPSEQFDIQTKFQPSHSLDAAAITMTNGKEPGFADTLPRSLNVFAKEFVPTNFQNNAGAHSRSPVHAPALTPVPRPVPPRPVPGFRPRGQARVHHRHVRFQQRPRFPINQPRVRPPFHDPQQGPPQFMWSSWSTADR